MQKLRYQFFPAAFDLAYEQTENNKTNKLIPVWTKYNSSFEQRDVHLTFVVVGFLKSQVSQVKAWEMHEISDSMILNNRQICTRLPLWIIGIVNVKNESNRDERASDAMRCDAMNQQPVQADMIRHYIY